MPVITVQMLAGRSAEQKRRLIRELAEAAVRALQVPERSVRVLLHELPPEHWGIGTTSKADETEGERR